MSELDRQSMASWDVVSTPAFDMPDAASEAASFAQGSGPALGIPVAGSQSGTHRRRHDGSTASVATSTVGGVRSGESWAQLAASENGTFRGDVVLPSSQATHERRRVRQQTDRRDDPVGSLRLIEDAYAASAIEDHHASADYWNAWYSANHGEPADPVMTHVHTHGRTKFVLKKSWLNRLVTGHPLGLQLNTGISWAHFMEFRDIKLRRRSFAARSMGEVPLRVGDLDAVSEEVGDVSQRIEAAVMTSISIFRAAPGGVF